MQKISELGLRTVTEINECLLSTFSVAESQNHWNKWIEIHLDWNIIQFEVLLDFNDIT